MAWGSQEALIQSESLERLTQALATVQLAYRAVDCFDASLCPDGLPYNECINLGDRTGMYHYQAWVRDDVCPHCEAVGPGILSGFAYPGATGVRAIKCPSCGKGRFAYPAVYGNQIDAANKRGDAWRNRFLLATGPKSDPGQQ